MGENLSINSSMPKACYLNGKAFEFQLQRVLSSRNIPCATEKLLIPTADYKVDPDACSKLDKIVDHLSSLLNAQPASFTLFKDQDGQADKGGHSADVCIKFARSDGSTEDVYISLKYNKLEMKSQRVWNLPTQLHPNYVGSDFEKKYKKCLQDIINEFVEANPKAYICAQLPDYEKLRLYDSINQHIGEYIRHYMVEFDNHHHYLNFLCGGRTEWIILSKENGTMLLYRVPVLPQTIKITDLHIRWNHIYIFTDSSFVFSLRLKNDERPFNEHMKIKFDTKLLDLEKSCTIYEVAAEKVGVWNRWKPQDLKAIDKEKNRRAKLVAVGLIQ